MVKNLAILAALASLAVAAPTNFAIPTVSATASQGSVAVSLSTGFTPKVALAMEACSGGLTASVASDDDKAALALWMSGAGKLYFDAKTTGEILSWCNAKDSTTVSTTTAVDMNLVMLSDITISIAGGAMSFVNGIVAEVLGGSCLCSTLSTIERSAMTTFLGLSGATLDVNIAGILNMIAKGGIAQTLSQSGKDSLNLYLLSSGCGLSADLHKAVQGWLGVTGTSLTVGTSSVGTGAGIATSSAPNVTAQLPNVVLTAPLISSLLSFSKGSDFSGLDVSIQTGLLSCAVGGAAGALNGATLASLTSYLSSSSCTLDAATKNGVQLWLGGLVGAGTQAGTSKTTYDYINLGLTMGNDFNMTGALTTSAQAPLLSFVTSTQGLALDASILTPLTACAKGKLASIISTAENAALSAWVASSSCALSSELKGDVLLWLSYGITGIKGVAAGVGSGAGLGKTLTAGMIVEVGNLINTSASLSSTCKGALGVAISSKPASVCSIAGRAELAAFLLSTEAKSVAADVSAGLKSWLAGC